MTVHSPVETLAASVIIVTFDGVEHVSRCVEAVLASTVFALEIIVVDNGSRDGTPEVLEACYGDRIRVLRLGQNRGPAEARNRGVAVSRARTLVFLDNDTVPRPDWLEAPLARLQEDPSIGAVQSKLLLLGDPDRFDYAGDYQSPLGFLIQRVAAGDVDVGQADERVEIFSAKSAGMIVRRAAFREAGGFDPTYFIYVEETDLAWRVWLAGYRVVFEPDSVVLHEFGTSALILGDRQNALLKHNGPRNTLTTILKCAGMPSLFSMLPANALAWVGIAAWLGLRGCWRDTGHILAGIASFGMRLPAILRQRRAIQRRRRIDDRNLYPRILRRRGFRYFYDKLAVPRQVGNAPSFYRPRRRPGGPSLG